MHCFCLATENKTASDSCDRRSRGVAPSSPQVSAKATFRVAPGRFGTSLSRDGKAKRTDEGEAGRFRVFTREDIAKRNDNLDISWLREDEEEVEEGLTEPDDIAAAILGHLRAALEEIEAVADELAETEAVAA